MNWVIWSPKQPSFLISRLARISELYSPHIRQVSNLASSSRTVDHNGKTDPLHAPHSEEPSGAANDIAGARSSMQLRKRGRWLRPPSRTITTLDPKRLDAGCFLDVSGAAAPHICTLFTEENKETSASVRLMYYQQHHRGHSGKWRKIQLAFPAGTNGFLYFHDNPENPLHSQLRFRITEDSDPTSFSRGRDLVYDKGYLWYLPVGGIISRPSNDPLLRLLVRDRLISTTLAPESRNSNASHIRRVKRFISSLDEPFVLDISLLYIRMMVDIAGQEHDFVFRPPHRAYFEGREVKLYDGGSALCRFERSILPEHAGKHTIVMRLLKMLDSPKLVPDPPPTVNATLPAEGELFSRRGRVWRMDLDRDTKIARVLRLLYDADDGKDADSPVRQ